MRLKVQWVQMPVQLGNVCDGSMKSQLGIYDTDTNTITLVKLNIGNNNWKMLTVLLHELGHWFFYKFDVPLNNWWNNLWHFLRGSG